MLYRLFMLDELDEPISDFILISILVSRSNKKKLETMQNAEEMTVVSK